MSSQPLITRGIKGYFGGLAAGLASALIFGYATMNSENIMVFLAYFAAIPIFFAGLGGGVLAGAIAALTGFILLYTNIQDSIALGYLVLFAVPTAVLTAIALRYKAGENGRVYWYPEGYFLAIVCLIPCALFLLAVAGASSQEGGLQALTVTTLNASLEPFKTKMDAESLLKVANLVTLLSKYLPSMTGISWITVIIFSVITAQTTLQNQKWNLRPAFEYLSVHSPSWLIYVLMASGLAAVLAPQPYSYVGINLFFILCIPFLCTGLAIFHVWAGSKKNKTLLLTFFYIVLSFVVWPAIFVALTGALDQWLNFRGRLAAGLKPKS